MAKHIHETIGVESVFRVDETQIRRKRISNCEIAHYNHNTNDSWVLLARNSSPALISVFDASFVGCDHHIGPPSHPSTIALWVEFSKLNFRLNWRKLPPYEKHSSWRRPILHPARFEFFMHCLYLDRYILCPTTVRHITAQWNRQKCSNVFAVLDKTAKTLKKK